MSLGSLVFAVLLFGFGNFFVKLARYRIDAITAFFWDVLGFVCTLVLVIAWARPTLGVVDKVGALWGLAGGISISLGAYFLILAFGFVKLAVAAPFSSLNVLVSALLGVLFLREALTITQIAGALLMIGGGVLLGISGGK